MLGPWRWHSDSSQFRALRGPIFTLDRFLRHGAREKSTRSPRMPGARVGGPPPTRGASHLEVRAPAVAVGARAPGVPGSAAPHADASRLVLRVGLLVEGRVDEADLKEVPAVLLDSEPRLVSGARRGNRQGQLDEGGTVMSECTENRAVIGTAENQSAGGENDQENRYAAYRLRRGGGPRPHRPASPHGSRDGASRHSRGLP